MAEREQERIGVVGSGVMGRGIVQLFATAGHEVWLHDSREGAIEEALGFIGGLLERSVAKGRLSAAEREATLARLHPSDALTGLADCDLVIEAIVEDMEAKQALFGQLEAVVASEAILASNTSSLSVTRLASACRHPERVAGFHFFNPVPLMKIAEVVRGELTSSVVIERLERLAREAGHFPAVTPDSPGFVIQRILAFMVNIGCEIVRRGIAEPETLDRAVTLALGYPEGPLAFGDRYGSATVAQVLDGLHDHYGEARYRVSPWLRQRIALGLPLGAR